MPIPRCPGQNLQFWNFDDIYDITCPFCDNEMEFWKDEPLRACPKCGEEVRNPHIDLGCAKWCAHADECLGRSMSESPDAIIDRLIVLIKKQLNKSNKSLRRARLYCDRVEKLAVGKEANMCVVKAAALLIGAAEIDDNTYEPITDEREILLQAGIEPDLIDAVDTIIQAVFSKQQLESEEFKIVTVGIARKGLVSEE